MIEWFLETDLEYNLVLFAVSKYVLGHAHRGEDMQAMQNKIFSNNTKLETPSTPL